MGKDMADRPTGLDDPTFERHRRLHTRRLRIRGKCIMIIIGMMQQFDLLVSDRRFGGRQTDQLP